MWIGRVSAFDKATISGPPPQARGSRSLAQYSSLAQAACSAAISSNCEAFMYSLSPM